MIALVAASALAQDAPEASIESANPRFGAVFEIGSLRNADPMYDLFGDANGMFGLGVRAMARPLDRLELRVGYQAQRHGANVALGGTEGTFGSEGDTFQTAFYGHTITLGARADVGIQDVAYPYVAADLTLLAAQVRFDDDPTRRDNPGQVSATGVSPGIGPMAGFEVRAPPGEEVQFTLYLEVGYTLMARMNLGDFGSMRPGGLTVRSGAGVRF